jgi:hypothetical protein
MRAPNPSLRNGNSPPGGPMRPPSSHISDEVRARLSDFPSQRGEIERVADGRPAPPLDPLRPPSGAGPVYR